MKNRTLNFFTQSRGAKLGGLAAALVVITSGYLIMGTQASGFFATAQITPASVTGDTQIIPDATSGLGEALAFGVSSGVGEAPDYANYPNAANTGYPHNLPGDTRKTVTLTGYTGPMTITADGTVIDSKDIEGTLVIKAKNVVIKNSRIRVNMGANPNANAIQSYNDDANLMVMDTEIDGMGTDTSGGGTPLVSRTGYTLLRTNIHGSGDIIRVDGRGIIQDSWLHDPQGTSSLGNADGQHHDVIQSTNATYIRVLHNRLENAHNQTSCILLKADIGPISDVVVDNNLMNGGGYTFYWYDAKYKISNGKVTNNRFLRQTPNSNGFWPKGGYYGTHAINAAESPVWTNNAWFDNSQQLAL